MLTRSDIAGRKIVNAVHYDGRTRYGWIFQLEGVPRLKVREETDRRTRTTTRVYLIDDVPVRDLDAALAALNEETP